MNENQLFTCNRAKSLNEAEHFKSTFIKSLEILESSNEHDSSMHTDKAWNEFCKAYEEHKIDKIILIKKNQIPTSLITVETHDLTPEAFLHMSSSALTKFPQELDSSILQFFQMYSALSNSPKIKKIYWIVEQSNKSLQKSLQKLTWKHERTYNSINVFSKLLSFFPWEKYKDDFLNTNYQDQSDDFSDIIISKLHVYNPLPAEEKSMLNKLTHQYSKPRSFPPVQYKKHLSSEKYFNAIKKATLNQEVEALPFLLNEPNSDKKKRAICIYSPAKKSLDTVLMYHTPFCEDAPFFYENSYINVVYLITLVQYLGILKKRVNFKEIDKTNLPSEFKVNKSILLDWKKNPGIILLHWKRNNSSSTPSFLGYGLNLNNAIDDN